MRLPQHPMHRNAMQCKTDKALHSTAQHSPHLSVHQDLDVFKPARKIERNRRRITHTATCSNSLPEASTLRHMLRHCADSIAQSNEVSYTHAVSTTCLKVAGSCTLLNMHSKIPSPEADAPCNGLTGVSTVEHAVGVGAHAQVQTQLGLSRKGARQQK